MSYEVWGDDDDGLDGVRESYLKTLLEDGWLDDEQANLLRVDVERYKFWRAHPRSYFVIHVAQDGEITLKLHPVDVGEWDRAYSPHNVDAALDSCLALSANLSATKGIGVTPASDNAKPLKCRLQYNKETKKIDRVQLVTGLVIDSFDPPEECDGN